MSNYRGDQRDIDVYGDIPNIDDDPFSGPPDDSSLDILNELNKINDPNESNESNIQKDKSIRPNNISIDDEITVEKIESEIKKRQSMAEAAIHNFPHPSEIYGRRGNRSFHDNYYRNLHDHNYRHGHRNMWDRDGDADDELRQIRQMVAFQSNMIKNMQNTVSTLYMVVAKLCDQIETMESTIKDSR